MSWLSDQWRHDREEVALEDETHDNPRATGGGDPMDIIRWFAEQQGVELEDLIVNM